MELQTAMISAFELCKKKAIPIQFAAKVPRLGTIGKNHIQSRFNLSEESVLFFCSESDTFLRNYTIFLISFIGLTHSALPVIVVFLVPVTALYSS